MATQKYEVELSEELAQHFGNSKEEVEERLFENAILTLLSNGDIDISEAAKLLNCDPDDLLTPEQEKAVAEGFAEIKRGEYVMLEDFEHELDNPTVKKGSASN